MSKTEDVNWEIGTRVKCHHYQIPQVSRSSGASGIILQPCSIHIRFILTLRQVGKDSSKRVGTNACHTFVVQGSIKVVAPRVESGCVFNQMTSPSVSCSRETWEGDKRFWFGGEEPPISATGVCIRHRWHVIVAVVTSDQVSCDIEPFTVGFGLLPLHFWLLNTCLVVGQGLSWVTLTPRTKALSVILLIGVLQESWLLH